MTLSIILFALSLVFYSISQMSIQGKLKWIGPFFAENGWLTKYEGQYVDSSVGVVYGYTEAPNNWYYKLFNIKYKERFLGSATIFVMFTDSYHCFQFLFLKTIYISICLQTTHFWAYFFTLCLIQAMVMNITFKLFSR